MYKILLIEDDETIVKELSEVLRRQGYACCVGICGRYATLYSAKNRTAFCWILIFPIPMVLYYANRYALFPVCRSSL